MAMGDLNTRGLLRSRILVGETVIDPRPTINREEIDHAKCIRCQN